MLLLFLSLLNIHHLHATTNEIEEARTSIRSLISPLLPGKKKMIPALAKDFRVDKCKTEKIEWSDVLLMRKTVTLTFKFQEGCDVEGMIQPKIFQAFPADLKLRNLKVYDRIQTQNTVNSTIESKPLMTIEMRDGVLYGKPGRVKFEADYQVVLNPVNREKPVEKNLGGVIRITEIYGKKVSIKEKIFVE
ncbi:MAG: hypothetical protein V4598_03490 [Bdellovibrionota bacterium]